MRGGGLEPPWLLTASTSNGIGGQRPNDFAALRRQEAPELHQKRPILVQQHQNSERHPDTRIAVTRELKAALADWVNGSSGHDLRLQLLRLLTILETLDS